ncbi:hypothetical protein ABIA41_000960 [Bradyrhizobium sp. USDA 313]
MHAFDEVGALAEFVLAKREMKAAVLLEADIEAGLLLQFGREPAPRLRRAHRPDRIGRHAEPLALDPDQRKVRARGALRDIALVEHGNLLADAAEAPGNGGAEQSAADDGDVVFP